MARGPESGVITGSPELGGQSRCAPTTRGVGGVGDQVRWISFVPRLITNQECAGSARSGRREGAVSAGGRGRRPEQVDDGPLPETLFAARSRTLLSLAASCSGLTPPRYQLARGMSWRSPPDRWLSCRDGRPAPRVGHALVVPHANLFAQSLEQPTRERRSPAAHPPLLSHALVSTRSRLLRPRRADPWPGG